MSRRIIYILIILNFPFSIFNFQLLAQPDAKQAVAHLQTIFIYRFTKYIEWPLSSRQGDFVIGILGDEILILNEMKKMAEGRKAGTKNIVVKNYKTIDDISECNILFIPGKESAQISSVIDKIKGYSTLLITEKEGMAKKGAAINFVGINIKLNFELNEANAEKYGLQVSTNLSQLAIIVD